MKIEIGRVVALFAVKKTREAEIAPSLIDVIATILLLAVLVFFVIASFHLAKNRGFQNFDLKENALLAFWLTLFLVLLAFAIFISIIVMTS